MTLKRAHYGFIAFLIGLFLAFQVSASSHATEYGDSPHEHDGISCVISTIAENDQGILPVKPEIVAERVAVEFVWVESFAAKPVVTNQTRAPPSRAPPHTFNK